MEPTTRERRGTVVIGGGQAGLATGYHLAQAGRDFVILDDRPRVGDSWRCHWDSLKLYSPAELDGLPGMPFPAARHSFPAKDDMADYLQSYAARFGLPVRHNSRVRRLSRLGSEYVVDGDGSSILAGNVVVATGSFGRAARTPGFAGQLDPQIRQLHSSEYRNPGQLHDGAVLVVGASHSGGDIAFEVASTHATILCGRDTGQLPLRLDGGPMRALFPLVWFAWGHVLSLSTPIGRKEREHARHHGAPLLRVRSSDLAAAGVERVTERVTGVKNGLPVLAERGPVEVANMIWCTGFRQDFGWIDLPVLDNDGRPREVRGVVPSAPGLYFTGLCFQSSFRSMLIGGAGADAEHVVRHLLAREEWAPAAVESPSYAKA